MRRALQYFPRYVYQTWGYQLIIVPISGIFNDFGPLVSWTSGLQFSLIQKQTHSSRKYEVATLCKVSKKQGGPGPEAVGLII